MDQIRHGPHLLTRQHLARRRELAHERRENSRVRGDLPLAHALALRVEQAPHRRFCMHIHAQVAHSLLPSGRARSPARPVTVVDPSPTTRGRRSYPNDHCPGPKWRGGYIHGAGSRAPSWHLPAPAGTAIDALGLIPGAAEGGSTPLEDTAAYASRPCCGPCARPQRHGCLDERTRRIESIGAGPAAAQCLPVGYRYATMYLKNGDPPASRIAFEACKA